MQSHHVTRTASQSDGWRKTYFYQMTVHQCITRHKMALFSISFCYGVCFVFANSHAICRLLSLFPPEPPTFLSVHLFSSCIRWIRSVVRTNALWLINFIGISDVVSNPAIVIVIIIIFYSVTHWFSGETTLCWVSLVLLLQVDLISFRFGAISEATRLVLKVLVEYTRETNTAGGGNEVQKKNTVENRNKLFRWKSIFVLLLVHSLIWTKLQSIKSISFCVCSVWTRCYSSGAGSFVDIFTLVLRCKRVCVRARL